MDSIYNGGCECNPDICFVFMNPTGRSIVTFEAYALIEYAKDDKIYDLEIANYKTKER